MPESPNNEKDLALKLYSGVLIFSSIFISFGITMLVLHYSSNYISMDAQHGICAENAGFFLLGAGFGLVKIACTAYEFGHRKPVEIARWNIVTASNILKFIFEISCCEINLIYVITFKKLVCDKNSCMQLLQKHCLFES